jgi:hypothetical protein
MRTRRRFPRHWHFAFFVTVAWIVAANAQNLAFFVSPQGDDEAAGTRTAPFRSLEKARDAIRQRNAEGDGVTGGALVTLLPGRHERRASFVLGKEDSGTAEAPIVYAAEAGAAVRLTGGRLLRDFRPVEDAAVLARLVPGARGHVMQTDLRAQGIEDFGTLQARGMGLDVRPAALELFFEDRPMPLARWPNEGFVYTGKVIDTGSKVFSKGSAQGFINPHKPEPPRPGSFRFSNPRLTRWSRARDVWAHGYWGRDWSDEHLPVASIDAENGIIHMGSPTRYGHYAGKRFTFLNLLEELDSPGEWYLDRETGILYFWPPKPLENARVGVSLLNEPLVVLQGASHVTFRGLVFEQTRRHGVVISDGQGVKLLGCTLRNIGNRAVAVWNGTGHKVVGCDIIDCGDGGVRLEGGKTLALEPGGHVAENNHIYRYNRWCRTYRPAITLSGVGNIARHNLIHDSAHMAVGISGHDHIFEYNEIHSVVRETTDSSALYTGGNPTTRGNVIRYNYFHHIGSGLRHSGQSAVYFDDGLCGVQVIGNLFYRIGDGVDVGLAAMVNGGRDHLFENNAFVDCARGIQLSTWSDSTWQAYLKSPSIQRKFDAIEPAGKLFHERYPALARVSDREGWNTVRRNLWYNCGSHLVHSGDVGVREEQSVVVDANPGFRNPEEGDFRMPAPAPQLVAVGFVPIPVERIGLQASPDRATWPVAHTVLPFPRPPDCNPGGPTYAVQRSSRPIRIDGDLRPDEWDLDAGLEITCPASQNAGAHRARAQLVHDGKALFIAVSVPLDGREARAGSTWRDDDAVEFAVRVPHGGSYGPILVWRGYAGGAFEVSDEAKAPESALRRARQDIDYAARVVGTERWTAEWLIPFQALGIAEALPAVPLRLPANLTVRMAVEEKWLMWHRPHGFSWKVNEAGTLELIP